MSHDMHVMDVSPLDTLYYPYMSWRRQHKIMAGIAGLSNFSRRTAVDKVRVHRFQDSLPFRWQNASHLSCLSKPGKSEQSTPTIIILLPTGLKKRPSVPFRFSALLLSGIFSHLRISRYTCPLNLGIHRIFLAVILHLLHRNIYGHYQFFALSSLVSGPSALIAESWSLLFLTSLILFTITMLGRVYQKKKYYCLLV
jgi:hypothetical protein